MNNDIVPPQKNEPPVPANREEPAPAPIEQLPPITPLDEPPRKSNKRRLFAVIAACSVALFLVAFACVMTWYNSQLSAVDKTSQEKVKVTIDEGSDTATIARELKENAVIRNEAAFLWYIRLHGAAGSLQSGSYRLAKSEDTPSIVKHLTSGATDTFSLTFLPGNTLSKHRQVLLDAGYDEEKVDAALNATYDHPTLFDGKPAGSDLEGYIYGETYQFVASSTPEQIIERTLKEHEMVIEENNLKDAYKKRGFTVYQAISLASIIQREVITPQDMAQVSQVFQLRLSKQMQLGSDVTYQYIADKTGQPRDVNLDSPYNTRRYAGLTPGPIASPGKSALVSVAKPAAGDFIYFLSGDDDKTYFARTNEEHERNIVQHCQKKCEII